MLKHRLFNLLIAIVLVLVTALTVREAVATTIISSQSASIIECASLPSRYSIHTEYMNTTVKRLISTEEGPTGVDGGLMFLLSAYQTCSR
jgi:hypothetical protein